MSQASINCLHQFLTYIPGQDFIGQGHYGKVKPRSHHEVAPLYPITNVPTKDQLPTPYSFRYIARTGFSNSRSLQVKGQIKVIPWHYTPSPSNQCNYQVLTSYTIQFLRYSPDKLFPSTRPPGHNGWKQYPNSPQGLWSKNLWLQ